MNTKPRVSIVTPTYNRAHLIERAINSVLKQTYQDWEYIIVDDASVDNTEHIIDKYKDPRIRYIKCQENGGNAVARNVGVKSAKGDYIAFLDSDDEYLSTYLEKALRSLEEHPKVDFLWAGTRTVAIDSSFKDRIWVPSQKNHPHQFLYELHVGIGRGFLIKRTCFDDLTFDERLRTAVDTDFLIRLRQRFDFTVLQEVLLNIHSQPGSVRTNYAEKKKSYEIIIQKHKDLIDRDKILRSRFYYKLFWLSLYDADSKLAYRAYRKLPFLKFKPSLLWFLFKIQNKEKAIELHRKMSSL